MEPPVSPFGKGGLKSDGGIVDFISEKWLKGLELFCKRRIYSLQR